MLGFGALKAMNDTIKLNRDMLKASRKNAADRSSIQAKVSENLLLNDKKMSEEDRVKLAEKQFESGLAFNNSKNLLAKRVEKYWNLHILERGLAVK